MQVQTIQVSAGRTFNHPHEQYSNLRPSVTMTATLEPGEDVAAATKALQAQAEQLVEDHKQNLLKSLEDLFDLTERQRELVQLSAQLEAAQRRIEQIRKVRPELTGAMFAESHIPEKPEPKESEEFECPRCSNHHCGPSGLPGHLLCRDCGLSAVKSDFIPFEKERS